MANKEKTEKLDFWQKRLAEDEKDYAAQVAQMDGREELYRGDRSLQSLTGRDGANSGGEKKTPHVRNVVAENIESQVSASIPQPKVTARRKQDEALAKRIEDMLRNELDRLPMEYINDIQERTVPIQGGSFYHVEWDNSQRTHTTVGEVTVAARHPKQVIPQAGVFSGVEDMDHITLKLPQTRQYIKRRYGVDLEEFREEEPKIRSAEGSSDFGEAKRDTVTQYLAYYRNDRGGIGLFSWANDTVLEDLEDYQARRLKRCKRCGEPQPVDTDQPCPVCGGKSWESREEEYQELWEPVFRSDGEPIGGAIMRMDPVTGMPVMEPVRVPYYKPEVYPLVLQRNVSVFGELLGESDADKMRDQQRTINQMEKKIIDRMVKCGSRIILPANATIRMNPDDNELLFFAGTQDADMIRVVDFTGDITGPMGYMNQVYEESRQATGITDSFQGRTDTTAKSGVAKQFAAAQSAGRMESKRVLKDAAYADLFRLIFQFKLAYADEPRPVVSQGSKGETVYSAFNRWDFLERDEAGEWYWNDQFLFSTDTSAPLANNREKMWEETISLFSSGCFGDPTDLNTLVALWTKLELLHYPGAGDTRKYLEERLEKQMQQQAMMAAQMQQAAGLPPGGEAEAVPAVEEQAGQALGGQWPPEP